MFSCFGIILPKQRERALFSNDALYTCGLYLTTIFLKILAPLGKCPTGTIDGTEVAYITIQQ